MDTWFLQTCASSSEGADCSGAPVCHNSSHADIMPQMTVPLFLGTSSLPSAPPSSRVVALVLSQTWEGAGGEEAVNLRELNAKFHVLSPPPGKSYLLFIRFPKRSQPLSVVTTGDVAWWLCLSCLGLLARSMRIILAHGSMWSPAWFLGRAQWLLARTMA